MGDSNVIFNKCMNENKRYAECFNMAVGRKIIVPEELYNMDKVFAGQRLNRQGTYEKRRDCIKAYGSQAVCAIIGIENQAEIHSAMVLRSFIYDAYSYDEQLNTIRKRHRENKDLKGAEYIAGFSGKDRIIPVITVCVYYGDEPWEAPTRLHELIDFNYFPETEREFVKQLVNDYRLIVLDVKHMKEDMLEGMETDLQYLFGILQHSHDRKEMEAYIQSNQNELKNIDEDIYNAIAVMTNTDILNDVICKSRKSGGGIDMCKAFEEMIAEGMEKGRIEEQKCSVQKLIITLREIGADEALIRDKVMLRYQLSSADAMEAMQIS